jgi:hypothetical protein
MGRKLTHFVIPAGRTVHEMVCKIPQPDGEEPGQTSWGDAELNHLFTTVEGDGSLIVELLDRFYIVSPLTGRRGFGKTIMDANDDLFVGLLETDPLFQTVCTADKWLFTVTNDFEPSPTVDNSSKIRQLCKIGVRKVKPLVDFPAQ